MTKFWEGIPGIAHRKRGETQCVFSLYQTPDGIILIPSGNYTVKVCLCRRDRWFLTYLV
jgi:hypothetical protein